MTTTTKNRKQMRSRVQAARKLLESGWGQGQGHALEKANEDATALISDGYRKIIQGLAVIGVIVPIDRADSAARAVVAIARAPGGVDKLTSTGSELMAWHAETTEP